MSFYPGSSGASDGMADYSDMRRRPRGRMIRRIKSIPFLSAETRLGLLEAEYSEDVDAIGDFGASQFASAPRETVLYGGYAAAIDRLKESMAEALRLRNYALVVSLDAGIKDLKRRQRDEEAKA